MKKIDVIKFVLLILVGAVSFILMVAECDSVIHTIIAKAIGVLLFCVILFSTHDENTRSRL